MITLGKKSCTCPCKSTQEFYVSYVRVARAYVLPKIHKTCTVLPKFRPIVNTTCTSYYNVASYLTELLNPLTRNEFMIRDSFDVANKINSARGF